jgi:hypothetical protein
MKLSNETLSTLKNFATINSNIVLNPGQTVKTMAESKSIMASATITEDIPSQIGIYDLNEFLGVVNMFDDPDLVFDESYKSVRVTEGKRAVKYFFSEPSILTSPTKDITMPPCEVTFTLSADDMSNIRKAASALGVTDCVIKCEPGSTPQLIVTDTKDSTANSYEIDLDDNVGNGITCNFVFNIGNFKFVNDDYDVSISSKLISNFKSKNNNAEYWVALEKNSSFGG